MSYNRLPESEAHLNDLRETVGKVQAHFDALRAECVENGSEWEPEQVAKWEGAFMMVRGLLMDDLKPLLESWEAQEAHWRSTEKMLGKAQ